MGSSSDRHRLHSAAPLVAALALTLSCAPEAKPPAANILLISIDTLRSDHLGAYGYARATSPNLDRLAREGARFSTSYAQASSTVPTHASLFTGRYPFQHRTFGHRNPLPAEELTLAEYLKQHGYRTLAITSSIRFVVGSGFEQGFESYEVLRGAKNLRTRKVIDTVTAALAEDEDQPVFAFAHFFDPHEPYTPPGRLDRQWHPGVEGLEPKDTGDFLQSHRHPSQPVDAETLAFLEALYDAEILFLDSELGRLFSWLTKRQSPRSTLVVVTSDHGEEFKEHGGLSHAINLHEELVRVPLLFHWPGRIDPGQVLAAPVQSVDVFPTLVDLLELPVPDGLAGRSQAAVLYGEPPQHKDPQEIILAQQKPETWALSATLATGRFKLESRPGKTKRLYHLSEDPGGHKNVRRRFPDETRAMEALADKIGVSTAPPREPLNDGREVSPEILDQLRAIGYAHEVDGE